jgi:2-keto-4-pentenoate hydratase
MTSKAEMIGAALAKAVKKTAAQMKTMTAFEDPRIAAGMHKQSSLRQARLAQGARLVGWKVGFGAPAAKEKLQLSMPLVGFLLDRALLPSGSRVSLTGWQKPVAEPEIAIYLGEDVAADADPATAAAAIAALGPAIEVADVDCPMDDVEAILAGDIFQRHVVLGPRDDARAGGRLDGVSGNLVRSGKTIELPADLQANTGDLIGIVRHVADTAARVGEGLRADHFIIAGSVVAPCFVDPGESINFALSPRNAVAIEFTN